MPQITYVSHDGISHTVEVPVGQSLMEGAVRNGIAGIDAECGGACACATCHIYLEDTWSQVLAAKSATETSMLDFAQDADSRSRLSCQIKATEAMDGMLVYLPASQG